MTGVELALGLARGAHIAAAMSVVGAMVFHLTIARSERPPLAPETVTPSVRRSTQLVRWSVVAALLTASVWLLLEATNLADQSTISGMMAMVPVVLLDTRLGAVLAARLGLLILAGFIFATGNHSRRICIAAALAACAVGLQAGLGHGLSMDGIEGVVLTSVEALHILAAATWLGGLLPLLLLVKTQEPAVVQPFVRRFSRIGVTCVLVLAVTILIQGWVLIGGLPGLVGTGYGLLACLKLVLFVGLLSLAALNRFRYTPSLAGPEGAVTRARLARSIAAEVLVGLCAVLAAGILLTQPPGMHEQPTWPFPYQFSLVTQSDPDLRNETLFGATLAIGAFAFFCLAIAWRRGRLIALAAAIGLGWWSWPHLSLLLAPAYPTSFYHSPTGFTSAAIARGQELFAQHCTSCHGKEGRGNGSLAKNLPIPPADLTAPHLFEHSDGEMFWWLTHGIERPDGNLAMPGLADVLEEDDRWNLIDYVRVHNAGLAIAATGQSPKPMQAPDISVDFNARKVPLSTLRGGIIVVAAGRDDDKRMPPLPPALGETEVITILLSPDSDDWAAYAITAGITPQDLEGTVFLVDPDGWLRAVLRPDAGGAWPSSDSVAAAIKDAQMHPITSDDASAMHHHH